MPIDVAVNGRPVGPTRAAFAASRRGPAHHPLADVPAVDPFAESDQAIGLSCRIYRTPDGYAGSPTSEQIAAAFDRE